MKKIIIAGGSGFLGSGIIRALSSSNDYDIHILSRHPRKSNKPHISYHKVNYADKSQLVSIMKDADWVIDTIGILFPNPIKKQNYYNSSIFPAKALIDAAQTYPTIKFLFVSANYGPGPMHTYIKAKKEIERYLAQKLPNQAVIIFPGLIYDKQRKLSYFLSILFQQLAWIPFFKKIRPVSRLAVSQAIKEIIDEKSSVFEKRI